MLPLGDGAVSSGTFVSSPLSRCTSGVTTFVSFPGGLPTGSWLMIHFPLGFNLLNYLPAHNPAFHHHHLHSVPFIHLRLPRPLTSNLSRFFLFYRRSLLPLRFPLSPSPDASLPFMLSFLTFSNHSPVHLLQVASHPQLFLFSRCQLGICMIFFLLPLIPVDNRLSSAVCVSRDTLRSQQLESWKLQR